MGEQTFVKDYKEWRTLIESAVSKNIGAPFVSTGLTLDYNDSSADLEKLGLQQQGRCYVTFHGYVELDEALVHTSEQILKKENLDWDVV